jgi:glutaredoxin-like protein
MRRAMQKKLLNNEIIDQIKQLFDAQINFPVELIYFTNEVDCETCAETHQLLEEISSLSDKIRLRNYDIDKHHNLANQYHIQLTPGLVIAGNDKDRILDYGIRLLGTPSGYEFTSLLQAIIFVSKRDSGLKTTIREQLRNLKKSVQLQVFVTPTWPYCPQAVTLAHQMAMESPMIQAEMIEANEFYELAMRYNVSGVPHTIINDGSGVIFGAVPDDYLLREVIQAIST